jgi:hypothetical protein
MAGAAGCLIQARLERFTEASSPADLQIEVKASERPISFADFHVSRNEWEVAQNAER